MSNYPSTIHSQLLKVRAHIPAGVTLVCVSKFHPVEAIREAYAAGEGHFGESRVQELLQKVPQLPTDIHWHFIGHLQTNKVRDLMKAFYDQRQTTNDQRLIIESVDSVKLLDALNAEAERLGIIQDILLEVHVAQEQTKSGFRPEEIESILDNARSRWLSLRICGLMTMATNTDDETEIRRCFNTAASLVKNLSTFNSRLSTLDSPLSTLSMGMSDDYRIAIECGSTSVRIGSAIFGERDYTPKKVALPKAAFFDMDGTLFNSMPIHAIAWEQTMQRHGLEFTPEDTYINEGRTGVDVIREGFEKKGRQGNDALYHDIYREKAELFHSLCPYGAEPIEGVPELLAWLHAQGVECWIVTGSGQKTLLGQLDRSFPGIFTPEHMITAYDVTHGKPSPEPYLKAWERSGYKKEECMVIENAPLGVRSGKAAGLFTVAVNTGILSDQLFYDEHADLVLHTMHELLNRLR